VRFLLDEAIQHRLADHLAEAGHDATHVVRIGLAGASDPEVLERAAAEDRILITTDTDFPTLLALSGEPIPSVLLLRGIATASKVDWRRSSTPCRRSRRSSRRARSPSWSGTGSACGRCRSSRPDGRRPPTARATHGWLTTWLTHGSRTSVDRRSAARSGRSCVRSSSASRTPSPVGSPRTDAAADRPRQRR
jgi:predicted nuclease of predicted toxin-antitoxin system